MHVLLDIVHVSEYAWTAVHAFHPPGTLHCRISDQGPGFTDSAAAPACSAETAENGRGLWMVQQLTDHLDITTNTRGTTVTLPTS